MPGRDDACKPTLDRRQRKLLLKLKIAALHFGSNWDDTGRFIVPSTREETRSRVRQGRFGCGYVVPRHLGKLTLVQRS